MGAKRGVKKRIHKAVCISCGAGVGEGITICSNCRYRQKLIRELQQMIRDTKEYRTKMATGNYWIRCFNCDRMFNYTSDAKKYCPECEKEIKRERNRKFMANKRKKASVEIKTISQVMQELKAYNEANGTCLSYGQYVLMTEYQ